jgi:carboxypeptidase family protein
MRSTRLLLIPALLFAGALAHAAQVTGTVTDKTTGKPAAGDQVVMLDVQAGMGEVAHATTDAKGRYSVNPPGAGPYLIRVTHQGAGYFIAAPQGGAPGDIPVYDVAAKVQGVFIEADVIEAETDPSGALKVNERYFVHNTSSPPTTQWSPKSFQIVLPPDAMVTDTGAQRPSGLPTSVKMDSDGPKGHYSFNFPIQPDDGEKDTLFQISYTVPYSDQKYTFKPEVTLPADNVAILLPKSMTFTPGAGSDFRTVNEDPSVQTFLLKNLTPGKAMAFTISGLGAISRGQQADNAGQGSAGPGTQPGGGIGEPINTPDPLSKYKWWILGGLALLLAAAAAFLLRRPPAALAGVPTQAPLPSEPAGAFAAQPAVSAAPTTFAKNGALLSVLKEELFAVESEKIAGTLSAADYAEQKAALEVVLRRALKRQ